MSIRTGEHYLQSVRDDRSLYDGGERIDDVVAHPQFGLRARQMAAHYDAARDGAEDIITALPDGEPAHSWYMPREPLKNSYVTLRWSHRILAVMAPSCPDLHRSSLSRKRRMPEAAATTWSG